MVGRRISGENQSWTRVSAYFAGAGDGELVLFLERGAGTLLTFTGSDALLGAAVRALATAAPTRHGGMTIRRIDGENALTSHAGARQHLLDAGFVASPGGLRIGRGRRA